MFRIKDVWGVGGLPLGPAGMRRRMEHPFRARYAGWLAVATAVVLTAIVVADDVRLRGSAGVGVRHVEWALGHMLVLCAVLYWFVFALLRRLTEVTGPQRRSGGTVALCVAGSAAAAAVSAVLWEWAAGRAGHGAAVGVGVALVRDGFVAATVLMISMFLLAVTRRQQRLLVEERTHAEVVQTRYDALVRRVDPHFLFNSLNTLDGLIGVDDERAHEYVHQLALSYRYMMGQGRRVTLAEELRFTDIFVAMMELRYGSGLRVERRVDECCLEAWVVPVSVQLLVENALQHNVASDRHPLTVALGTRRAEDGLWWLWVRNALQPKEGGSPEDHGSMGLGNLGERCRLVLHRDIAICCSETEFCVEMPVAMPGEGREQTPAGSAHGDGRIDVL